MIRGTTPTLKVKINGVDLSRFTSAQLTIKQHGIEVTKQLWEMQVEDNNTLSVFLQQEDTLKLHRGYAYIQLRGIVDYSVAVASNIKMISVDEILKGGVII